MIDASHNWFKPLWRRLLVSAATLSWSGFELYTGNPGWALIFFAMGVWALFLHRGAKAGQADRPARTEKDER
ncbi:hypothetical protein U0C82_08460 [Fulvimarina sp. 2208YS6-2-32]|uniref:DUF3329 domain-containing protein n=1 Tax=Fulvimarina uroteuthidis TaxID=3098149 RepID=A0ABU5I1C3_9HYPH|nr:hypothetical protein [Fulvimarina sp. 2208YS6-2-32]MDY8109174.1 hypothetical protein [Fulvimarina sp. 2208YS6-2-32]